MIPAIWLGNFALVFLFKLLFVSKKLNYIITSTCAILVKAAIIFAGYDLLLYTNVIPQNSKIATVLFSSMGINQIITGAFECVITFAFVKLYYNKKVQS